MGASPLWPQGGWLFPWAFPAHSTMTLQLQSAWITPPWRRTALHPCSSITWPENNNLLQSARPWWLSKHTWGLSFLVPQTPTSWNTSWASCLRVLTPARPSSRDTPMAHSCASFRSGRCCFLQRPFLSPAPPTQWHSAHFVFVVCFPYLTLSSMKAVTGLSYSILSVYHIRGA